MKIYERLHLIEAGADARFFNARETLIEQTDVVYNINLLDDPLLVLSAVESLKKAIDTFLSNYNNAIDMRKRVRDTEALLGDFINAELPDDEEEDEEDDYTDMPMFRT